MQKFKVVENRAYHSLAQLIGPFDMGRNRAGNVWEQLCWHAFERERCAFILAVIWNTTNRCLLPAPVTVDMPPGLLVPPPPPPTRRSCTASSNEAPPGGNVAMMRPRQAPKAGTSLSVGQPDALQPPPPPDVHISTRMAIRRRWNASFCARHDHADQGAGLAKEDDDPSS